jgi:hypothetical protein
VASTLTCPLQENNLSTIQDQCPCGSKDKALRHGLCRKCRKTAGDSIQADRQKAKSVEELSTLRLKYGEALRTIERQERQLDAVLGGLQNPAPYVIEARKGSGTSEATPVVVLSDWHCEEAVGAEVGGLNRYDLSIAKARSTRAFQAAHRLIRLLNQDVTINTVVVALLGDFITGNIHGEENAEKNLLPPTEAIVFAQDQIISGLEFLLEHTNYNFVLPCHSGNHARTTHTTRFATENGHSLEYLMYRHLAAYFRNEPRLMFQIAEGMHSYVKVYGTTLRFHHGHAIKYGGGVGGIYIPTNKAIAQWNKAKSVDVDVFGHFHQSIFAPNFVCNGSLIGYNAFALSIKADFERPQQGLFLIDKKRGRTCSWPILVE